MRIEMINTGAELMLGRVLNSHQQWLCRQLTDLGCTVDRQVAVDDSAGAILGAVATAGAGGTLFYLFDSTQDPDGDPIAKQAFLDYRVPLGAAVLVSAGTLVVGGGLLGVGMLVE